MFRILIFAFLICNVVAQFEQCDVVYNIQSVEQSAVVNYPGPQTGSNCRYSVIAPVDSTIEVSCNYNVLGIPPLCFNHRLSISRSGDKAIRDENYYCGRGSFLQRSIGNEIVLSFKTNRSGSPSFQCTFKAVASTNANCDCGWNVRTRIVGGSTAGVNEFVSHAGLVDQPSRDVFCGATIVSQLWSVTAAHCFDAYPNVRTTGLLTGDHDLTTGSDTIWAALYLLEKFIKHESYNSETNANDIALMKTQEYIKFNRGVGPACLPYFAMQNDLYFDGKFLTAVGWGTIEFGGPSSKVLKKATLQVVNLQTCSIKNSFVDRTKICTNENRSGSCQKDSGGALYWSVNRKYLIGIVSYGTYCASNIPSVNTRVTSYVGWIERNTGGFFCRKS